MPKNTFILTSFISAAIVAAACSDQTSPLNSVHNPPPRASYLQAVEVTGPDDIPLEEGEVLPEGFRTATLIYDYRLDVGYLKPFYYATARMRYVATNGLVRVTLKTKKGDTVLETDSSFASDDQLLPAWGDITARKLISVADTCGYSGDGDAAFSAWMAFPVTRIGSLFTWGRAAVGQGQVHLQPVCPPVVNGRGGGGGAGYDEYDEVLQDPDEHEDLENPYEGTCQNCQLWFAMVGDSVIGMWWECAEIDPEFCELLNDVY